MTTASRPTFDPAKGGQNDLSALSKQYSSRDLPSHTKLKYRETGQGTNEEIRGRDFRRDLEERERAAVREKEKGGFRTDRDRIRAIESSVPSKRPRQEAIQANIDADDAGDDDSDSSDSDEDDTAELMAELARIKAERAAEAAKREEQQRQREEQIRIENILQGNPLLQYAGGSTAPKADLRVKRRWDDDVVFKNCSRSEPDKKEKGFVNDSLRSEFHRRFMEKYIK